jgi:hypothetical protein
MVSGAFMTTGMFFLCFFSCCAWLGLNGRVRGTGRSKWWGVEEMRIDRPPLGGPGNRAYYPTSGRAGGAGRAVASARETIISSPGGFFASLPSAERMFDPVRESLLGPAKLS